MRSPTVRRACLAVLAAAVCFVLAGGSAAYGALVHPFAASFGSFASPQAVAVDQSTGDVYVIDVGAANVQKFDASGSPVNFSAVGSNTLDGATGADTTPEGSFGFDSNSAAELAIDNSGGPADGDLYVANSFAGVIDVFDPTGTFVGEIDGTAATPQTGGETCGVATDPSGHVYSSSFNGHVDKYTPTDADPAHDTFNGQLENLGGVCNVAADGLGNVYVSVWSTGPLTKYDQAQLNQDTPSGTQVDDTSLAVAVDPSNDDVYVDHGDRVVQYDSSGNPIGQSGSGQLTGNSFGVAVRGSSGDLYASNADTTSVDHFGPAVNITPPSATIDPASNVTATQATFNGTVNPGGADPLNDTDWHFEYSTDGGDTFTSTPGGHAGAGTSDVPVTEDVTGFVPNQQVQVRLVASNGGGTTTSTTVSFTTTAIAPDATTGAAQGVTPDHAALSGLVDPHNSPTTYFFEYGPTTAYGTSVPAGQDGDAGSANAIRQVIQAIGGLTPATTYHFRLVATNQAGTSLGQDQTFTTTTAPAAGAVRTGIPGTGFLPDDRGWEKVSPNDKNGGDVMADTGRARAASDGSAAQFSSLAAFGDAVGTSLATDYESTRGAGGWETHAITPPQKPLTIKPVLATLQSLYAGAFSSDLSKGVFLAWSPLTADPNVADAANAYLRTDLRSRGAGTYQLLSSCPLCDQTSTPLPAPLGNSNGAGEPFVAGASTDFGHVIFESQEPLTAQAPAGCDNNLIDVNQCPGNLYEWDHGVVRSVGILPDGTPALGSQAGQGAGAYQSSLELTPHTISADGSRIFFTVPASPGGQSGALYMRVDHASTVQLNNSERSSPDPNPGQPAEYWDASADGSRVFFTTTGALTDDAPVNGDNKLYMYDASVPDSDPHNLTFLSPDGVPADAGGVDTVAGVSTDGHYVYFTTAGQLVAGQPLSDVAHGSALYVWHDGTLRFISFLSGADADENATTNNWSFTKPVARVTPDGLHLLFGSSNPVVGPTGYDQSCTIPGGGRCRQLYVYSYDTQQTRCASCNPTGAPATGSAFVEIRTNNGVAFTTSAHNHPLSDDGRRVFFTTPEALVAQDTNSARDVYEYDVPSGTVHLLTNGHDDSDSFFMDASASGDDVFFVTRGKLAGTDVDTSYDLYDARAGGGFTEPPPPPPICSGDACQPPQSTPPGATAPGTSSVTGNGNVVRKPKPKPKPVHCRKGFVPKKVHGKTTCVRKPKHKKAKRPKKRTARRTTHATRVSGTDRRAK
jgi:hypothetical protein